MKSKLHQPTSKATPLANERELAEFIFVKLTEINLLDDASEADQINFVTTIESAITEFNARDKQSATEPESEGA